MELEIVVTDDNDNSPEFRRKEYYGSIRENEANFIRPPLTVDVRFNCCLNSISLLICCPVITETFIKITRNEEDHYHNNNLRSMDKMENKGIYILCLEAYMIFIPP